MTLINSNINIKKLINEYLLNFIFDFNFGKTYFFIYNFLN